MPLTLALGQLFDSVVVDRRHIRPFANALTRWSYRQIRALASLHADLVPAEYYTRTRGPAA